MPLTTLQQKKEFDLVAEGSEVSVKILPLLWADDLHCLKPEFAIAFVQALFEFKYPVIFTISEERGFKSICEGVCISVLCMRMYVCAQICMSV